MSKAKSGEKNNRTLAWQYYEDGILYNQRLVPNQYTLVDTNIDFYVGNQWVNLPMTPAMSRLPKPMFNITKRVTNSQVANLMSGGISVNLEPLSYYDTSSVEDPDSNACEFAQAEIDNLFNKLKINYRSRDALFDGAITGDYCAHFYFDAEALPYGGRLGNGVKGEIRMELVDGINVMFGNPNTCDVESQPYILLIGRDTVDNLNEEAKRYNKNADTITSDMDTEYQSGIGGKTELVSDGNAKATYVYLYTKVSKKVKMVGRDGDVIKETVFDKNGEPVYETDAKGNPILDSYGMPIPKLRDKYEIVTTVHVTKSTKDVEIYTDVDTGLSRYPIAWGNWERQKNQYHGRALVTGIAPNQIFINTMFAMVMRHLQLQAFPKRVYNADLISRFSAEIGVDIGVHNLAPGQPINQVATVLPTADMSNQIIYVIDKAMEYTKDCLGSTDAALGNSNIDNTSALMTLTTNSQTPLQNPRTIFNEWIEDIVSILLDMMGTYYGRRPIVRERSFSEPVFDDNTRMPLMGQYDGLLQTKTVRRNVIEEYDFSELKHLYFNVRIDVGNGGIYDEAAMMQTLDNMRREGVIEFIDYLERVPDRMVPQKQALIQKLKKDIARSDSGVPAGMALPDMGTSVGSASGDIHRVLQQMNPKKIANEAKQGQKLTADDAINSLPVNVKEQFDALPSRAKGEVARMAAERMKQ